MHTFKKSILTLTTAAALGIGAMGTAQAGSLAVSVLEVQNFLIQDATTGTLNASDFQLLQGNNTGDVFAFLNSTGTSSDTTDVSLEQGIDLGVCEGPDCLPFGPNDFQQTAPPPTGNYVLSDNLLEGAAINFPGAPPTTGANASTRGDVSLLGLGDSDNGSAQTNLGLNTTFEFVAAQDFDILFTLDYDNYLRAFVSDDLTFESDASASSNWTLTITGSDIDYNWTPAPLNSTRSTTGPGNELFQDSGSLNSATDEGLASLTGGERYRITIRHTSLADASVGAPIPEPTSIALLGGGLLGLAAMRKRAKKA
jgi:hypothetical protein